MAEIILAGGQIARVDAEDFESVTRHSWHLSGGKHYAVRSYSVGKRDSAGWRKSMKIFMHRQIMGDPPFDGALCDHVNGNKLDNRKENLRWCTKHQNAMNRVKPSKRGRQFKGVYFQKKLNKYHSQIRFSGKTIHLGTFECQVNAAKTYNLAAKMYFGPFARLNNTQGEF